MPEVLSKAPVYVCFESPEAVDSAIKLFCADPVISIFLMPEAQWVWDSSRQMLCLPNSSANRRIRNLLDRFEVAHYLRNDPPITPQPS